MKNVRFYLLSLLLLICLQSCLIFKSKKCREVDGSALSKFAQDEIAKGVLKGDTVICRYHLIWTTNSRGDSQILVK
jgi:hypothetical protein